MSIEQFYHLQDKGQQTAVLDTQQCYLKPTHHLCPF